MEASGTPTPEPDAPAPPPPPAEEEGKPSAGWRALAVVLALALAFACAVMVIAMVDIGDTPVEEDCIPPPVGTCTEYFDGSSTQKAISLVLGWPSGILAGLAALVALYFAATARGGRLLVRLTGAAIVLGALSILIGSV